MRRLRLGEGDHVTNALRPGHQHDHAIQAERDAAVRRRTVLQRPEQEAEFLFGLFAADVEQVEDRRLHVLVVDTNRSAADLRAVQHHVVRARQCVAGIGPQRLGVIDRRRGERMVQRGPARGLGSPLEHREIHHPERRPAFADQAPVLAQLHAQGAQRVVDDPRLVGAEEDHVARRGAGALQDALDGLVRQELEYR